MHYFVLAFYQSRLLLETELTCKGKELIGGCWASSQGPWGGYRIMEFGKQPRPPLKSGHGTCLVRTRLLPFVVNTGPLCLCHHQQRQASGATAAPSPCCCSKLDFAATAPASHPQNQFSATLLQSPVWV